MLKGFEIANLACSGDPVLFGIFDVSYAPALLFYSYIPIILLSLFFAFLVLKKDKYSLKSWLFFGINASFIVWTIINIFQWITVPADLNMFLWQIISTIELSVFLFTVYFFKVFLDKKDIDYVSKSLLFLFALLPIIFLSTKINILYFDTGLCEGISGLLWNYIYTVELLCISWIVFETIKHYFASSKTLERYKILILGLATGAFLFVFSGSNLYAESLGFYEVNLVGPIGLVVFLGMLTYLMVRYHAFNIKLIGTQALVAILWIAIGSILFVAQSEVTKIIVASTEIVALIFGLILIGSVKREVKHREEIERLAAQLKSVNVELRQANVKLKSLDHQKSEFLSFATHQLRSPLTAIKGYASMLMEGSFGPVEEKARGAIDVILQSSQKLVVVIEDFLNISRIELGTMKFEPVPTDLKELLSSIVKQMEPTAAAAKLALSLKADSRANYTVTIDPGKITQVATNLIDNAIKYTKEGSIALSLSKKADLVRIEVKDTGVGISEETMGRLFEKFSRADDASKMNMNGTGLGLYVAKQLVEAHGGKLWAESEGVGKGSTFIVELPVKK